MAHFLLIIIYLSFISLGLPDGLLGSAWPMMYPEFQVPVSYAGSISIIIAVGTVISSFYSDRFTRRFGTGIVTAVSVAMTAVALLGFSFSHSFLMLCFWSIPYGLGAGSVDASLNNYVAIHYDSHHMSWLHCMWGVGASIGPWIMGYVLTANRPWNLGYFTVGSLQALLSVALICTLPLWRKKASASSLSEDEGSQSQADTAAAPLPFRQLVRIPGAKEILLLFFSYCALEQTTGLWASSYLALCKGLSAEAAAGFASMYYIGITIGRAVSGFLTFRFNDKTMIRMGLALTTVGLFILFLPLDVSTALIGFILIGLGCAPIYPCAIHSTPLLFGEEHSPAFIGAEMAVAYTGILLMPPLFGFLTNYLGVSFLPTFLLIALLSMVLMHERLIHK